MIRVSVLLEGGSVCVSLEALILEEGVNGGVRGKGRSVPERREQSDGCLT